MSIEYAEVQTLTAEVHVLMVGNRQVTLSMAYQLDQVLTTDIVPFGRVSLQGKNHAPGMWVIGACKPSGELVVSRAEFHGHEWLDFETMGVYRQLVEINDSYFPITGTTGPEIEHKQKQYSDRIGVALGWADLPLIVLAGLR